MFILFRVDLIRERWYWNLESVISLNWLLQKTRNGREKIIYIIFLFPQISYQETIKWIICSYVFVRKLCDPLFRGGSSHIIVNKISLHYFLYFRVLEPDHHLNSSHHIGHTHILPNFYSINSLRHLHFDHKQYFVAIDHPWSPLPVPLVDSELLHLFFDDLVRWICPQWINFIYLSRTLHPFQVLVYSHRAHLWINGDWVRSK